MVVIVDAYNLLRRLYGRAETPPRIREQALTRLQQRADSRSYRLIVVFDGGSSSLRHSEQRGSMTIIEPGYGRSADAYIIDRVTTTIDTCFVVTADNALGRAVKRPHVAVLDPLDYWHLIGTSQQPSTRDPRTPQSSPRHRGVTNESANSLDALMEEAASHIRTAKPTDIDTSPAPRTSPSRRLSKHERHWLPWIEKL